ncbi:MAG: hypothetical protein IJ086_09435 [Clostridium sp.]|nr:hypothetical protein [Clostridium sp.]
MAQYTLELREIIKSKNIFNSINYELYNNDYKPIFEEKFIKRYYFREIGCETVGRFLIYLETMLNEIMPYYTRLYKTTTYKYDPLLNYDLIEETTREIVGENTTTSLTDNMGDSKSYDTPITRNNVYKNSPSFISETNDKVGYKGNNNNKTNEVNKRTTKGNIGVMATQDLIEKERKLILDIDRLILDDLEVLFMQVF